MCCVSFAYFGRVPTSNRFLLPNLSSELSLNGLSNSLQLEASSTRAIVIHKSHVFYVNINWTLTLVTNLDNNNSFLGLLTDTVLAR